MKTIILAAGRGKRYRDEGYDIPKPLIRYKGKPFIEHAIEQFKDWSDVIVVATREVAIYTANMPGIKVVPVENIQAGPAMSALLAGGYIEDHDPVLLADSDVVFRRSLDNLRFELNSGVYNGLLTVAEVTGDTRAYCSVMENNGRVEALEEKTGTSKLVATGVYGFLTWRNFRNAAMKCALTGPDDEVYLSQVLDRIIIHESAKVCPVKTAYEDWVCLGTPKDLVLAEGRHEGL